MAEESTKKPSRRTERIGKYEIIEHIASGGMGIVYKARDPDLDRDVALKILPTELAQQATTLIRFQREAKAAAKLRHENIVSIYEIGEFEGKHFIALEYVDGTDLQAYIGRKCRLDPKDARLLMVQAARALVHAHENGIVHRDIKPSNFLLTFKDKHTVLKLTDFGLAIQNENDEEFRITKDKTTVGTVDYMSPEQARDSRSADIRSDIYSLGCTFYHMLGGNAPFARGTLPERIVQHMRAPPPDVRKLNASVPEPIVAIIQRMLAKKPDERYQTPGDLLHDLENMEQVPLPRKPGGSAKQGRTASRKSNADMTSVIANKDMDEASAEPPQVKSSRADKTATMRDRRTPRDLPASEADSDETVDTDAGEESTKEKSKESRRSTQNRIAASSPIWMYAIAGAVTLIGLILVMVFAFGSRPLPKRETDKKAEIPVPPNVVTLDKKTEPPDPLLKTARIDTTPEKMMVEAPLLPRMDFDPATADLSALRTEYYGPFQTFPTVPAQANAIQVRRLNSSGASSVGSLADALTQTKADQFNVIEIADNGPIFASALPMVSKRTILLRGGEGYRPMIVWDLPKKPVDTKAPVTFLELSAGRLILENLDFVMSAGGDAPTTVFDLPDSDFFARNCTFSLGGQSAPGIALIRRMNAKAVGVETRKTQTWMQRCYLRGPAALLLHHHESSAEVLLEDSLLVGYQHPLLSISGKDEDSLALHCVRSTLVTGQVLARWQASQGTRINPLFQGRMLDSILSRDDPNAPQGDLLQIVGTGDTNRMRWSAANSVYAGWKQLLASQGKNIAGHDLESWHRHWAYSLSDRVISENWPPSPPAGLEDESANSFRPTQSPVTFAALTGSGAAGCIIGRLPPVPERWRANTLEPRTPPVFAGVEAAPPRIETAADGMYHGERLDLNKVDLGAYLQSALQKVQPAPRVVMHLAGKGVCNTSPLRIKGVQHLVLYFEPAKDPLVLEVQPASFTQRVPLIEMTGGHLELIGARIRVNPAANLTTLVHAQNAHLTVSRSWLFGPLAKSSESFKSLITVTNQNANPALVLMRDNVLVSSKLLLHAKENVQVKARNNVLVSLGDGVLFDVATPGDSMLHSLDHNTWAIRQSFVQLRAGPNVMPAGAVTLFATNNAFLRPFDGDTDRAALTRGFEDWSARGYWSWQGRNNVFDARIPAYHVPTSGKNISPKQTLSQWQRVWGQAGEHNAQSLDASMATRELTIDGMTPGGAITQLERLLLPRQIRIDATQGTPGADLYSLGILKKKLP